MPGRVLIATADPRLKGLLVPLLEGAGFEPVVAPSLVDAVKKLEEGAPTLIVLDKEQPQGQSAFVFLRTMAAKGDETPVVFAVSGTSPEDLLACFRLGAAEVIRKPARAGAVKAVLSRVLKAQEG